MGHNICHILLFSFFKQRLSGLRYIYYSTMPLMHAINDVKEYVRIENMFHDNGIHLLDDIVPKRRKMKTRKD